MTVLKALVMLASAILAAVLPGLVTTDSPLGIAGVANIVVLAAGAIMVYNAANLPGYRYAKLIAAAVAAGGVVFIAAYSDAAISPSEWVQIILAVLGAAGVGLVPNSGTVNGVFTGRHERPEVA